MKGIVIIGTGFAGLAAAKALRHENADVLLIDRANHNKHRFDPEDRPNRFAAAVPMIGLSWGRVYQ